VLNPQSIDPLTLPSVVMAERKALPEVPCIYFAIDSTDAIQYIGRSVNPRQRWQNHHRQAQVIGCRIAYMQCDEALLGQVEQALIEWFAPALNGLWSRTKEKPVALSTKWKLAELMARHRISNKELAAYLDMRPNSITDLKRAESMPRINGEQLDRIAAAVTALSKIGESIKGIDLLEDRD